MNKSEKIMVVDDALFMRTLLYKILHEAGYTNIIQAYDGENACYLYDEESPSLIFMDISMPEKNGIEALQHIIQKNPTANIVMCSAIGQEAMILEAMEIGARDFIIKPFKPEQILLITEKIIHTEGN